MPLNLFIDTNIFLAFYHLTGEDLEELKKLAVLLEKGEIRLFLPKQVMDEFNRNREGKIADALRKLREQRFNMQFPQMCKDYAEYAELRRLQKQYEEAHAQMVTKIEADVSAARLKADELITELFSRADLIPLNPDLVERSRLRMDLGNPPGKNGSLGDAINWEALLEHAPAQEAFHFVTDDKDYWSQMTETVFSEFLSREWEDIKGVPLSPYRRLSAFFKSEYPKIELASEIEKDLVISQLASSPNFATTHSVIAKLESLGEFSPSQARAIISAAASNRQVYWILNDDDVEAFIVGIIRRHEDDLDPEEVAFLLSEIEEDDEGPDLY